MPLRVEMRARICSGLEEVARRHGFRAAARLEGVWVKDLGDGVLQRIGVIWVTRMWPFRGFASLGFAYQLVDAEKLWVKIAAGSAPVRHRYGEGIPSLYRRLDALAPGRRRSREWEFTGGELPKNLVPEMAAAIERHGLPYLERFRTREEVFAESEREHLARKRPQPVQELKHSCREFCCGRQVEAIARVERTIAALAPGTPGVAPDWRLAAAEALLEYYRSHEGAPAS